MRQPHYGVHPRSCGRFDESKVNQRSAAIRLLAGGSVAWAASLIAAALYIAPTGWRGAGDLVSMAVWSAPFALVIAGAGVATSAGAEPRGPVRTFGPAVTLGPALGIIAFAAAAGVRGGWVVAFPVFSCWAFGGLLGLVAAVLPGRCGSLRIAGGISLVGLVVLLWSHAVLRRLG
jgi:hypothetical protein